ncbi:MAG: hypothetical protein DMD31_12695 [Gemmatimonadetes bacterium]|nr:MAG: hypothetical protein DMD31_12695 [Gemmatimonadota bacterium]
MLLPLFAVAVQSLSGQDVPRLQARADSLVREWRRASALADMVDSLDHARAAGGTDTISVGALRIVTNPSPARLREAASRAWPVIDSLYGTEARQLAQRPYLIAPYDPDTTSPKPTLRGAIQVPWDQDVTSLAMILVTNVPIGQPDAALHNWLGGLVVPIVRPEQARAAVYVQLVTAPSQAARSCFLGVMNDCRNALGLAESPDPLRQWYPSVGERRALVVRAFAEYFGYLDHGARKPTLQSCGAGSDAACTELLRSLPPGVLPRPLTYDARAALVHIALRLGGREAYHRLIATPALPIPQRLAGAAGVSVDSLVSLWRAEILAARPAPVTVPPWGPWVALGWTAVFAVCALRSSRWRVS